MSIRGRFSGRAGHWLGRGGGEVFVPKIPSMRIMDLVQGIASGCEIEFIGIRSGEKLHEVLVSRDESRHTRELDNAYVVQRSICGGAIPIGVTGNPSRRVFSTQVMRTIAGCPLRKCKVW